MLIQYQEIDNVLLEKIVAHYGEEILNYNVIHLEEGSCSLAAIHNGTPIGLISTFPLRLATPLDQIKDAYIDVIEVDAEYRRQGIARELLKRTEQWACKQGYSQLRAWSSQDKIEAIPMWYKLQYCMCPAKIYVEWCKEIVDGFYVVKKLNTAL